MRNYGDFVLSHEAVLSRKKQPP